MKLRTTYVFLFLMILVVKPAFADAICDSLQLLVRAAERDFEEQSSGLVRRHSLGGRDRLAFYGVRYAPFPTNEQSTFSADECDITIYTIDGKNNPATLTCKRNYGSESSATTATERLKVKFEACLGRQFKRSSSKRGVNLNLSLPADRFDSVTISLIIPDKQKNLLEFYIAAEQ